MGTVTFTGLEVVFILLVAFLLFTFILLNMVFYYRRQITIRQSKSQSSNLSDGDWKHGVRNLIKVLEKVKPVKRNWIDFMYDWACKFIDALVSWFDNLVLGEKSETTKKVWFIILAIIVFTFLVAAFIFLILLVINIIYLILSP